MVLAAGALAISYFDKNYTPIRIISVFVAVDFALRQIAGVGTLTSLAFVLTLEDPARFAESRKVAAYLGLTPGSRQSGERDPQLGISKQGDPFLRQLLVQSAHYILGPFGP